MAFQIVLHWSGPAFGASVVTNDGQHLYYCAAGKASRTGPGLSVVTLRVHDVATGATSELTKYDGGSFCELAMSGRDLLLGIGADGIGITRVIRYDLSTGRSIPVPIRQRWVGLNAW